MSNTVIKIENLTKEYRLGTISHGTLYRDLQSWVARVRGKEDPNSLVTAHQTGSNNRQFGGRFLALDDVSFDVKEGTALGIIGRNGAGKSTLLKIISRVTAPTRGEVKIKGRVASLLEVGTGFHPELTGRENIYLNGTILGMNKKEIGDKFDEIVAFSGIEKFIDSPVKRYSSGMYVRLAFAVAAHLESEILVVDEVLAVGDIQFQKQCLGKMQDISHGGRAVLFVSHSLQTISSLCDRCLLLEKGKIKLLGSASEAVLEYLGGGGSSCADFTDSGRVIGDCDVQLLKGEVLSNVKISSEIDIRESLQIRMVFRVLRKSAIRFIPNFHFVVPGGSYAFVSVPQSVKSLAPGDYEATCHVPGDFLNEGTYYVGLAISSYEPGLTIHFFEPSLLTFLIIDPMEGSVGRYGFGYANVMPGIVRPQLDWKVQEIS
jgi:lipopolysaccharide transport system ATP-binding protein